MVLQLKDQNEPAAPSLLTKFPILSQRTNLSFIYFWESMEGSVHLHVYARDEFSAALNSGFNKRYIFNPYCKNSTTILMQEIFKKMLHILLSFLCKVRSLASFFHQQ